MENYFQIADSAQGNPMAIPIISRTTYLPQPVVTNRIRINIIKGQKSIAIKLNFIGAPPKKLYKMDTVLDKHVFQDCK